MAQNVKVKKKQADQQTIYRVTIKGLAKVSIGKDVALEPYEVTVRMNEAMIQNGPLSSWRNYLAPKLLPKIIPHFQRVRTQEIIDAVREDGEPIDNINVMSFSQLAEYVDLAELPVNVDIYNDAGELRDAIKQCQENEEAFTMSQKRLALRRGPEVQFQQSAEELNADFVLSLNEKKVEKPAPPSKKESAKTKTDDDSPAAGI